MKTKFQNRKRDRQGYALVLVLILTAVTGITLAAVMMRTSTTSNLNDRSNRRVIAINAAEAATEKVLARMMADYALDADKTVTENEALYRTMIPTAQELAYWGRFEFNDAQGTPGRITVERLSNIDYVELDSQYAGLKAYASTHRIYATARLISGGTSVSSPIQLGTVGTTGSGNLMSPPVAAAVRQDVQLAEIPLFQFAIFYNNLLEFTWAAPLTVRGRVHANDHIYLGSSAPLVFESPVTATGTIEKKAWDGFRMSQFTGSIKFEDTKSEDAPALTLPIGTENSSDAVREILNPPADGEPMNSEIGMQRFYNKAELLLLIEDSGITAQVKHSYDSSPITIPGEQLEYFLDTNPEFTDQREGKVVSVTEIDVGRLGTWAQTNSAVTSKLGSGQPPTILYVADNRTVKTTTETGYERVRRGRRWVNVPYERTTTGPVELAGVRLVNGRELPTHGKSSVKKGLTVATPNPLYVKGDYNDPSNLSPGSNDTSATEPAALISDALTVLSPNWNDSQSSQSFRNRPATHTTINAAILTGMVYSKGSDGSDP